MNKKKRKTEFLHHRIDPDTKNKLSEAAERDCRSIASAVDIAIRDYIFKMSQQGKEDVSTSV
jgi:predicted transcriptional regulator